MQLTQKVKVKNRLGLHTRPATTIVKLLQTCRSEVFFTHKQETVNAKSILSLLMLAASKDALITIVVEGDDEDAALTMDKLVEAFENEFGEAVHAC